MTQIKISVDDKTLKTALKNIENNAINLRPNPLLPKQDSSYRVMTEADIVNNPPPWPIFIDHYSSYYGVVRDSYVSCVLRKDSVGAHFF
jgi:hypothetical protein